MENKFIKALRGKYRFKYKGVLSTEEIWELNVRELDIIFKGLNSQLKEVEEESLLNTRSKSDIELEAKIEIVKFMVATKLEEENKRKQAKERKEERQRLLGLKANRKLASEDKLSDEELDKRLEELDS